MKKSSEKKIAKKSEAEVLYEQARKERKKDNLDAAIDLYKKVLELKPGRINCYYYIGLCYDKMGYLDDAVENLKIFNNKTKDTEKIARVEKILERLDKEIQEEERRLQAIQNRREDKYRDFLEVKWINGIIEIPALKNVRERLKIEEARAKVIEAQVKAHVEANLRKEKQLLEEAKKETTSYTISEKEIIIDPEETLKKIQEKEKRKEEAKKNYYLALEMAWADGSTDEYEDSYLQKMRRITGVSEKEAREIEKEVKENLQNKIKAAKQEWYWKDKMSISEDKLKEIHPETEELNIQYKAATGHSLLEVRMSEIQEAGRREAEAKKLLEESLKQKEMAYKKYEEEVEAYWTTGKLSEDTYSDLRNKRTILGLSDREALEIEKRIEIKRKKILDEEDRLEIKQKDKKLSPEEELSKKRELIPLTIESSLKKTVTEGTHSFLMTREFHASSLYELRAFILLAHGEGQYKDNLENITSIAVKTLGKSLGDNKDMFLMDIKDSRILLKKIFQETLHEVFYRARSDNLPSIKLNMIALLIMHNKYLIGNIGNTRTYIINEDKINQITRDQQTRTIMGSELEELINNSDNIRVNIFPKEESLFDLQKNEVLFLCSSSLVDILSLEEIRRQVRETDNLNEAFEGLANVAYFIKEGAEDIALAGIETGRMKRISSTPIIRYDSKNLPQPAEKSIFDKLKTLFRRF
ncbi:MAG TPA: hypothetical protein PL110_06870 [Candidatus Eremiobacteraeota bacterium]|nr:MAG: hypothetical protein BWY64_00461 [bacterium ADurb.Bin363]HPZ07816.1 hypothetical protein [Candidatus Eremiobacteraeota bacterium]